MSQIQCSDVPYLESVEHWSFAPVGWLYASIFEALRERGLVNYTVSGGFIISDSGAQQLNKWRETTLALKAREAEADAVMTKERVVVEQSDAGEREREKSVGSTGDGRWWCACDRAHSVEELRCEACECMQKGGR